MTDEERINFDSTKPLDLEVAMTNDLYPLYAGQCAPCWGIAHYGKKGQDKVGNEGKDGTDAPPIELK